MAPNKAPELGFFLAIFCILVLLVSSEVTPQEKKLPAPQEKKLLPDPQEKKLPAPPVKKLPRPDQNLCEKPSATWSGMCVVSSSCDKQCREWEHAEHGACHFKNASSMCFCYVNCAKA